MVFNESYAIELKMNCNLFGPYFSDLESLGSDNVKHMDKIIIEFKYFIPGSTLKLVEMVNAIEYSLLSVVLRLETIYPFVFSFYCRKLFGESFDWMKRDTSELLLGCNGECEKTYTELIVLDLWNIHMKCQTEFNTLSLMQAISNNGSSIQDSISPKCDSAPLISLGESIGTLRRNAYHLSFFLLCSIEENLVRFNKERPRSTIFVRQNLKRIKGTRSAESRKHFKIE